MLTRYLFRIILLFFVSLYSCNQRSDLAVRFEMEKMVHEADKMKQTMMIKGPVLSADDIDALVMKYSAIMDMVPLPTDSTEVTAASQDLKEAWAIASLASIKIGLLFLDTRKYDDAFKHFEAVIQSPATTDIQAGAVRRYMAVVREKQGRYEDAARLYEAYADYFLGVIDPAKPDLKLLEAPITTADMWRKAGDSEKFKAQLNKARSQYESLIAEYPNTPLEHLARGKVVACYLKQDNPAKAIDILKATKDAQTNLIEPEILLMIADIYSRNLNDYKNAEKTYAEFLSRYPDHENRGLAKMGLGLSLYEQGKYTQAHDAIKDIETVPGVKANTVADAYYLSALCYEKQGRWERALNQFDLIQATFPGSIKSFEARLYVANYYRSKGQKNLANKAFAEAEDYIKQFTNPGTSGAPLASQSLYYLARCYNEQADSIKAVETLIELHNRYPTQPHAATAALELADYYEKQAGDKAEAIIWLTNYGNENPEADNIDEIEARIRKLNE
jgi:tetratricopeptide (TPR) repeat protein